MNYEETEHVFNIPGNNGDEYIVTANPKKDYLVIKRKDSFRKETRVVSDNFKEKIRLASRLNYTVEEFLDIYPNVRNLTIERANKTIDDIIEKREYVEFAGGTGKIKID